MKLLMITNDLFPFLNANSGIVYRLAKELVQSYDCDITILGYNTVKTTVFPEPDFHVQTVRMKGMTDYARMTLLHSNRLIRLLFNFFHIKSFRYYLRLKRNEKTVQLKEYQSEIKSLLKKQKFDCIIAFTNPVIILKAIINLDINALFVNYKLDPWATNYYIKGKKEDIQLENDADKKAGAIITTGLIKKDYETYASEEILKKISVLNFPNIIQYDENKKLSEFQDGKIHCVFAGCLYAKIRDPHFTLDLFENMNREDIVLHIFSNQCKGLLSPDLLPENIIFHGFVSNEEALQYMQSADILVNIGNTVLNQMPSKILTYISLGKPILNIIKSPNCPTLPYMGKYPLACNVLETPEVLEEDVERVKHFILENKGKQIPFEEIKEKYYTCTPEYVGGQLYDIICKVVEEHKEKKEK